MASSLDSYGEFLLSPSINLDATTKHQPRIAGNNGITNRTASMSIEERRFCANARVVTSEGSSVNWRGGKKKQTVSAALLIALGVAGIVIS